MKNHVKQLAFNLNLSPYQSNKLIVDYERYNMSRLEKRGGVLYAPYQCNGFFRRVLSVFCGVRADLIGENKMLLCAQRNIKFYANGYHSVRVGRYVYYADATGNIISRGQFLDNIRRF
jgi:hypothetical protein